MVEEEAYCIDILHQTVAVRCSIDRLNRDLLESHLETFVKMAFQQPGSHQRDRVIREILDVFAASHMR